MSLRPVFLATLFFLTVPLSSSLSAAEWFVDGSVEVPGDGTSPETAFKNIQEGIDAAFNEDTVIVAEGLYVENIRFNGKSIILRSTDPLDGNVVQNTIIDGNRAGSVVTFDGTEEEKCVLSGFTIRNGRAQLGGGILGGDWSHRTLATIQNNIISGNRADGDGGGLALCDGRIRNNTVANNSACWSGGGLNYCSGTILNNTIVENCAEGQGGGLNNCDGDIENSIIADNSAAWGGGLQSCGGTIRNNTITGNSAGTAGGLWDCAGTITNCVIWGNLAPEGPELLRSSLPTYSCIRGWEGGGVGNISACPHFVDRSGGDYHLQSWSPCVDVGDPASDFSNEPEPNAGRINIGAYGNTPEAASASDDTDGDSLPDEWEMLFFDNLVSGAEDDPDGDGRSNIQEHQDGTSPVWGRTWYVDATVSVSGDGSSWERAFKTIREGIGAAWEGETVTVAPGIYVENIHFEGKNIALRSTDPLDRAVVAQTIIDGGESGSVVTFVGSESGRCALSGFTIRNGKASDPPNERGGGIRGGYEDYRTRAVIENNVITNNSAWDGGGLVYCGGLIRNNIIADNSAEDDGGGLHRCGGTVEYNTIIGNSAGDHGGAIAKSTSIIRHNLICQNSAGDQGGALRDCDGTIESNTFADNIGTYGDALALCDGAIRDCIILGGSRHGVQLYHCNMPTYCCIDRWKRGGLGNISHCPYFVDADKGDYHLQSWSPCIDAGDPVSLFSEEPEPNGGRINLGVYGNTPEAASKSLDSDSDGLPDDWEVEVFEGLDQLGADDPDDDHFSNMDEYRRGSDPKVAPVVWYVSASVGSSGDGTSQATPFKTIQEATQVASGGDTVIVAPGIYYENVKFNGKNMILRGTDPLDSAVVSSTIIDGNELDSVVSFLGSEDETCVLAGFTIRNGSAPYGGGVCGGTDEEGTHAAMQHNSIIGNSAPGYWDEGRLQWLQGFGGGLAFCDGLVSDNIVSLNSARLDGGGLYGCDAIIQNNTITDNRAEEGDGGGLDDCDGTIQNNLVADNDAADDGGGLSGCDGAIQSNTIVDNHAVENGGGLLGCLGTIRNCIIWANVAKPERTQIWESNAPSFCCIEEWAEGGEGNIVLDPRFVDAGSGDYHVEADSPCINAGTNFYWHAWPQRDLDGNCRLVGPNIDMGCYERDATADEDGDLLSDSEEVAQQTDALLEDTDGDGLRDGLEVLRGTNPILVTPPSIVDVPGDFLTIQEALCLAVPGDEIIVSPGTYNGNLHFCGTDVTLRSTDPDNPEVVASTVLGGGDTAPVVCFVGRESPDCVLSGFTISNGRGDHGCGIRGGGSKRHTRATIRKNTITNNYALRGGAGLAWCDGTIVNNTISNNEAEEHGGGLSGCHGTIQSNTIAGNWANWGSSGIYKCNGSIRNNTVVASLGSGIYGCHGTIEGNAVTANFRCGFDMCHGRILNNAIVGNSSSGLSGCDGSILNNAIVGNWGRRGGGLNNCNGSILNNTIAMNRVMYSGGGLYMCNAVIRNCVIWGNIASGADQIFQSSDPTYSCIQDWTEGGGGNIAEDPAFVGQPLGAGQWTEAPTFNEETFQTTFVDQDASWQPDALVGFPLNPDMAQSYQFLIASNTATTIKVWGDVSVFAFVGEGYAYGVYDYRLSGNSPCIDAGKNEDWMWGAVDLEDNNRILPATSSWRVDMGAYEYLLPTAKAFIDEIGGGLHLRWTSQPGASYTVWSRVDLLDGEWLAEATVASEGDVTSWTDWNTSRGRKFYRIEIQ